MTKYIWPERFLSPGTEKFNEKQFERDIISQSAYCGFTTSMHIPYSVNMPVGYPDITLVRVDPRAPEKVYFEVKGPRGQVRSRQLDWLNDLRVTGDHAYLVQPKDYMVVIDILRNVYDRPEAGTGLIDPELLSRLSMNQITGERL